MAVFDNVRYYLSLSLSAQRRAELVNILDINGARPAPLERATHVITNTNQFEGYKDIQNTVHVVTDKWVDRSIIMGKNQPEQCYSADSSMIFSGIVACATDLPEIDLEVISAGVTALGGQWRMGLTRDVTHLFALAPGTDKYDTAMHFRDQTKMVVLLPHWFDDSIRLGIALPTAEYEWPEPVVLRPPASITGEDVENVKKQKKVDGDKKSLFKTALVTSTTDPPNFQVVTQDVWQGRKILLSSSFELAAGRREAVEAGIKRCNGVVLKFEGNSPDGDEEYELQLVEKADILITRYRSGAVYFKAARAEKTIGTLSWLFYVESTGILSPPTDQLLHYPIPRRPIDNFFSHEITVTNYTGDARDYLKRLITAMGAKFTPSMSRRNTVVIAAYISGNKATKARNWSIPVVNHTWLEDCFVQWRNLTVGLEKYIVFPPGVDFSQILGERGVGRVVLDDLDIDMEEKMDLAYEDQVKVKSGIATSLESDKKTPSPGPAAVAPTGTETSIRDVNEVEEVIVVADADDDFTVETSLPKASVQPVIKPTSRKRAREQTETGEDEPNPPRHARKNGKKKTLESVVDKAREDKTEQAKPAKRRQVQPLIESEDDDLGLDQDGPSRVRKETKRTKRNEVNEVSGPISKAKESRRVSDITRDSGSGSHHEGPSRRSAADEFQEKATEVSQTVTESPRVTIRTPRRTVSVLVPPLPKGYPSSPRSSKKNVLDRTGSIRVEADNASASPAPKRQRPIPAPAAFPDTDDDDDDDPRSKAAALNSKESSLMRGTPSTSTRSPSRRSAAAKATSRLRDEVMPDVINFEREVRNKKIKEKSTGEKRQRASNAADMSQPSDEERLNQKQRTSLSDSAKRRRNQEDVQRSVKSGKIKPVELESDANESDDDSSTPVLQPKEKGKAREKDVLKKTDTINRRTSLAKKARTIKLMTTQVVLSEDVIKRLGNLGIVMTARADECTHLLAKNIVRTEKFLCAMAVSPYILKAEWATTCVAAKELLPEDRFLLEDSDSEKKWNFKLSESLQLAKDLRESKGGLFAQMTFYVTPKVSIDIKLLKNVVAAGGGQALQQNPTVRLMKKEDRYVISCPEDISIWRPLVQHGVKIYSTELILTSVLRQKIDWEDIANKVTGSY